MGNFLVRHASRVVIYDHRAVIRLATEHAKLLLSSWPLRRRKLRLHFEERLDVLNELSPSQICT